MELMALYNAAPIWAQNAVCSLKGYNIKHTRYNQMFKKMLFEFEKRNSWTYDNICEFRDFKLRAIIKHAYETVPYYKNLFDHLGLLPKDIITIDDLKKLPVLTKKIVNDNQKDFISSKASNYKLVHSHTSGTTGSGFKFITTDESIHAQWAAFWRQRHSLGIDFNTWMAEFGSRLIVPIKQKKPPFWRIDIPNRRIYFSAFHENEDNMLPYYREIESRQIPWIHGFPSLLMPLAQYMNENGLKFNHIKWVTTGAENLLMHEKSAIAKAFGVVPIQVYGQAENVAIFSQQKDDKFYVDEDFSAVEFTQNENGTYDVIGTNLWNYAMPLIRWQTGDTVTIDKNSNGYRKVLSIDGRKEDYISLPNGVKIGKLDHAFKDTISIREAQICQKSDFTITVYIVGDPNVCGKEERIAYKVLAESTGGQVPIRFEYIDKIPRTKGGKLQFVISEIK